MAARLSPSALKQLLGSFDYAWRSDRGPVSISDWRAAARRALPRMVWAYVENGADDERTLRANVEAFDSWVLRQRVLQGAAAIDVRTEVVGTPLSFPVLIAPTGLAGAVHWQGDLGLARAAESRGTRLVLSSASGYTVEEVGHGVREGHWFQLYPWRSRLLMGDLMARAQDAGFTTLVVTVDVPVYGNRVAERRTGMAIPPVLTPQAALDAALHPRWLAGLVRHQRWSLKNLEPPEGRPDPLESVAIQSANLTADVTWSDLEWMRDRWSGPLIVKGLLDPGDAEQAVRFGIDGIVVSNHGGRQLDPTLSSLAALAGVVDRVGNHVDVLMDGGVRRGSDVVVALALGAKAVLVGRPALYGLAAGGAAGVAGVLDLLRQEMERALALMGIRTLAELDRGRISRRSPDPSR